MRTVARILMYPSSSQQSATPARPEVPKGPDSRRRRFARTAMCERGQATLEFALVLPVVVAVLFGIALFGLALNDWIDETQLASQAARFAAVNNEHGTGAEISEASFLKWVTEQGDNQEFAKGAKAEMCSPSSQLGDYLKVRVTYNYTWLGMANFFGNHAETPITSTATMRIEVPPAKPYPRYFKESESSKESC
jgi:Flp pilus assembly protein TadG